MIHTGMLTHHLLCYGHPSFTMLWSPMIHTVMLTHDSYWYAHQWFILFCSPMIHTVMIPLWNILIIHIRRWNIAHDIPVQGNRCKYSDTASELIKCKKFVSENL